jgi:hypothetical protein
MQGRRRGVKAFLSGRIGRILLIVIAILAVLGAFLFAGVLFAILAVLIFGLGIPIWSGASQPRYLAILGVCVLAVSPALITAVEVPLIMTPPGVASSSDGVMQNATVTPFLGSAGTNFTWTVQIFPSNVPTGYRTINLTLYISTCPGATGNSSPFCSSGYPLYWVGKSIRNLTVTTTETFTFVIPTTNIWNWQMGLYLGQWNPTTHQWTNLSVDPLAGDPTYHAIEGPITANWDTVYYLLVGSIYLSTLLYLGLAFFIALLVYVIFRLRRQRKQQAVQRSRPPPPATSGAPPLVSAPPGGRAPPGAPVTPSGPVPKEVACPNCGAVVYPNETFCWKCGAALGSKGAASPTSSSPKG